MKYLVDTKEMKAIDAYTINHIGIPSLVLMERAALAAAGEIIARCSKNDKILAVCGMGNNGGDGVCAARILREAGFDASVLLAGEDKKASLEMKKQLEIGRKTGLPIFSPEDFNNIDWEEYNIIIDSIFGIGLARDVTGSFAGAVDCINKSRALVFSVDIPSGINADTGRVMKKAVKADYTVTFGYNKLGLILYPGALYAGTVITADIGFPSAAAEKIGPAAFTYDWKDKERLPKRRAYSNKGDYGRVLVAAGRKNMCGAAYLCALSALKAGAGLVKVVTCEENRTILQTRLPEAILSTYKEEAFSREWFLEELSWADTAVVGPGLGGGREALIMADAALAMEKLTLVLDADGLNAVAFQNKFSSLLKRDKLVITPHLKEMSRLILEPVSDITEDMAGFVKRIIKDAHLTLVLKDARTLVGGKGQLYVNTTGNSGMAKGGSGDVLAGIIGGLLGQGMSCFEAAALSVYLHGLAGDRARDEKGEYSMLAGDITDGLSYVMGNRPD